MGFPVPVGQRWQKARNLVEVTLETNLQKKEGGVRGVGREGWPSKQHDCVGHAVQFARDANHETTVLSIDDVGA